MTTLIDAFLYAGETDMAELRRLTLGPHVDYQLAVACDRTYQNEPAEYPTPDGIPMAVVSPRYVPVDADRFWIERAHRAEVTDAVYRQWPTLPFLASAGVLLVSDVDEIPDPASLPAVADVARLGPVTVPMRMHGFALDYRYPVELCHTTATTLNEPRDPQHHRNVRYEYPRAGHGWHLSWLGDADYRARKLATFSHTELAALDVEGCYRNGVHAEGTRLRRLSPRQLRAMSWPEPILSGEFVPPASWWSPDQSPVDLVRR